MFNYLRTKIKNKLKRNKRNKNKRNNNELIPLTEFSLSKEALKHSISYSDLLSTYVKMVKRNSYIKDTLKILFFFITIGSLVFIVYLFGETLKYAFNFFENQKDTNEISIETILSVVTIVIPAVSSLIVAFIKIPEIIAEYLFNIEEDNYMNSIIKNIQDHDQSMFAMEHKINVTLAENKTESIDDNFEDSPNKTDSSNRQTA